MINSELGFREISLPGGKYTSRMGALNACLKAISTSHLQVEKIAIFEEPPHAFLEIAKETSEKTKPGMFGRLMTKTSDKTQKVTTLKLMIHRMRSADNNYVLKYEINP